MPPSYTPMIGVQIPLSVTVIHTYIHVHSHIALSESTWSFQCADFSIYVTHTVHTIMLYVLLILHVRKLKSMHSLDHSHLPLC